MMFASQIAVSAEPTNFNISQSDTTISAAASCCEAAHHLSFIIVFPHSGNTKYSIPPISSLSKYCVASKISKKSPETIEKSRKILDYWCRICYSTFYLSADGFIFVRFFSGARQFSR